MHHQRFGRLRRRHRLLGICAAWAVIALVAASLTQLAGNDAAASSRPTTSTSEGEVAAGLVALGASYPGGFPALINEFYTGSCAGLDSYESASPACQSIIDEVVSLGAGQSAPQTIPDLGLPYDSTIGPWVPPDPSENITPAMIDELEQAGAPADLIAGLRQDPPYVPPQYRPRGPDGSPSSTSTLPGATRLPLPSARPTALPTDLPTDPPSPTDPTDTTDTTTLPTSPTDPTDTTDTTTLPTSPTDPTESSSLPTSSSNPPPPPPPHPPLLVAVGDSLTSGHEAREGWASWYTECDDKLTSWAENLRGLIGVPPNRYFNFAHSGSNTGEVLGATPYTNPCGVVTQQDRTQIADAAAVLAANRSVPGWANVAVATAGINDTNWVNVAELLVGRRYGGMIGGIFGYAPGWAIANPASCQDYVLGNPNGNPGAGPGAVAPAWNGVAVSGNVAIGNARIALGLISADPGAQVRHLLYYQWTNDPNLPNVCGQAANKAGAMLNGWISTGIVVAKLLWAWFGGDARRIEAVCGLMWNPGAPNVQTRLLAWSLTNWRVRPGWPHPTGIGRARLAGCVNPTLPRVPGAGIG